LNTIHIYTSFTRFIAGIFAGLNATVAIVGVLASLRGRMEGPLQAEPVASLRQEPGADAAEITVINPVCGVAVSTINALHIEKYAGVSYYFCCDGCWRKFLADPAKYAAIRPRMDDGSLPGH
jgi:YHS domain-containing protein